MTGGTSSFYHFDALGSVTEITDAEGNVTDRYRYNAFGEALAHTGTTINPHTYVGRERYYLDSDTGLYLLGLRYYSGSLGKFLTLDPLRQGSLWYAYVGSRPTLLLDPTGQSIESVTPCQMGPGLPGKVIGKKVLDFFLTGYGGDTETASGWTPTTTRTVSVLPRSGTTGPGWMLKWKSESKLRKQCEWNEFDVPGTTYRVAMDTGGAVKETDHLDLYLSAESDRQGEKAKDALIEHLRKAGLVVTRNGKDYVSVTVYGCKIS